MTPLLTQILDEANLNNQMFINIKKLTLEENTNYSCSVKYSNFIGE